MGDIALGRGCGPVGRRRRRQSSDNLPQDELSLSQRVLPIGQTLLEKTSETEPAKPKTLGVLYRATCGHNPGSEGCRDLNGATEPKPAGFADRGHVEVPVYSGVMCSTICGHYKPVQD